MTVHSLKAARDIVSEMGPKKIEQVYVYLGASGEELYAVFTKEDYIDIHDSPYVRDPELIFLDGKWLI